MTAWSVDAMRDRRSMDRGAVNKNRPIFHPEIIYSQHEAFLCLSVVAKQ